MPVNIYFKDLLITLATTTYDLNDFQQLYLIVNILIIVFVGIFLTIWKVGESKDEN